MQNQPKRGNLKSNSCFFCIIIIFHISSCIEKNKWEVLNGEWVTYSSDKFKGQSINIIDGKYNQRNWNGDVISQSYGVCLLNRSINRQTLILTLLPDIKISGSDTIILKCENIEINYINDSIMCIQEPSRWVKLENSFVTKLNDKDTLIRREFFKF